MTGLGKTALVHSTLAPRVKEDGGVFLAGKFRQPFCSLPKEQGDTLVLAIEPFAEFLLDFKDPVVATTIKRRIRQVLVDHPSLINVVPKLGRLVGFDSHTKPYEDEKMAEKVATGEDLLLNGLCKLFRSICSKSYPLVLFLGKLRVRMFSMS